ncbi:uncharacterized protein BO80DRAFT_386919 [Aspergillus ibericus CBS 121593]|uniref:Uncharacterized protein n=1 Tax=Aspergillus ibericus CBS 121593 TaxID=1448316 RepID=A0A395GUH1_9EURO|nr:hypothetical protein BO80DRAFT_386919 [Aspergillus ibericus CBS 121593]RAK98824.1 hypothetical protein BO80DRAFT_386919 [Aspergillus ibericus CBS 121593]
MAGPKSAALLLLLANMASASLWPMARGEASSATLAAAASATSTSTCWKYSIPANLTEDDIEQNDASSSTRRRSHDGIMHLNHFARRGHDDITELGKCKLTDTIYKPKYFTSKRIQSGQDSTDGYSFLGYFIPKLDSCDAAATYTTIAKSADVPKATAAYWDTVEANTQKTYLALGTQIKEANAHDPHINIDHVYELQILDSFLTAMIEKYNFCDSFNTWFLEIDTTFKNQRGELKSRLQKLYSFLPGQKYPDLVAEDSRLNSYKAPMFGSDSLSGLPTPSKGDALQSNALSIMNTMAVVVAMLRDSSIANYFKNSNTRIYKAFLGIDSLMASQKQCNADLDLPQPNGGWASAYSSWMEDFVQTQANAVSTRISAVSAVVTSTEAAGVKNIYGKALDAFNEKYPASSWKWENSQLLDWSAKDGTAFAKRESSVAACTPTSMASSSAKASHSASSKATPAHTGSTATETGSHSAKATVTSSHKATVTPTTHTSSTAAAETKTRHSSESAEVEHSSKTTSSAKVVDTETSKAAHSPSTEAKHSTTSTKTTTSEAKETTSTKGSTSAMAKETTSTTSTHSTTSTKATTSEAKETTSTTSTHSTTSEKKTTTTTEAKETEKATTTKEEKTKTTTKKSSEATKDSSSSSSSCKKKKCKKG